MRSGTRGREGRGEGDFTLDSTVLGVPKHYRLDLGRVHRQS